MFLTQGKTLRGIRALLDSQQRKGTELARRTSRIDEDLYQFRREFAGLDVPTLEKRVRELEDALLAVATAAGLESYETPAVEAQPRQVAFRQKLYPMKRTHCRCVGAHTCQPR